MEIEQGQAVVFQRQAYLEEYEGDGEEEAGKSPPPSPLLLHPLTLEAVQLSPWQEHQQQGQAGEKRQNCIGADQGQTIRIRQRV